MSPSLTLSRKKRPPQDLDSVDVDDLGTDDPPIASATHQVGSTLATKASTTLLISCLLAGPAGLVAGGLALASTSAPTPATSAKVVDESGTRAIAGEFAERLVVTWLTTGRDHQDQLTALMSASVNVTVPDEPFSVTDPSVAGIANVDGVWSVTVAATVTDQRKQSGRRYYQVPVLVTAAGAVSGLALPTPIAGPVVTPGPGLNYQVQVPGTGPVAQTISQFLTAYAAGTGDVTRYLTPGVQIRAIDPAPYATVMVTDLRAITSAAGVDTTGTPKDGSTLRVLVTATGVVSTTQQISASWALTMTARAGRWEIAGVDLAPALLNPVPPAASPSNSPSTAPASTRTPPNPAGTTSPPPPATAPSTAPSTTP